MEITAPLKKKGFLRINYSSPDLIPANMGEALLAVLKASRKNCRTGYTL